MIWGNTDDMVEPEQASVALQAPIRAAINYVKIATKVSASQISNGMNADLEQLVNQAEGIFLRKTP